MNKAKFLLLLLILLPDILFLSGCNPVGNVIVTLPSTSSEEVVITLPLPTDTPPVPSGPTSGVTQVLEDFENNRQGIWFSPDDEDFKFSETTQQAHGGNKAFLVDYTKTNTFQYIGVELPSTRRDFTQAQVLEVWVYGQVEILAKLEDEVGRQVDIDTQTADNPAGWTRLSFNYANAGGQIDLAHVKAILFFPAPNVRPAHGIIFFDDIALVGQP